jgi:hypothetical protein
VNRQGAVKTISLYVSGLGDTLSFGEVAQSNFQIVSKLPTRHGESSGSLHRVHDGAATARPGRFLYFPASNAIVSEALGWPPISGRS